MVSASSAFFKPNFLSKKLHKEKKQITLEITRKYVKYFLLLLSNILTRRECTPTAFAAFDGNTLSTKL